MTPISDGPANGNLRWGTTPSSLPRRPHRVPRRVTPASRRRGGYSSGSPSPPAWIVANRRWRLAPPRMRRRLCGLGVFELCLRVLHAKVVGLNLHARHLLHVLHALLLLLPWHCLLLRYLLLLHHNLSGTACLLGGTHLISDLRPALGREHFVVSYLLTDHGGRRDRSRRGR